MGGSLFSASNYAVLCLKTTYAGLIVMPGEDKPIWTLSGSFHGKVLQGL